MRKAGGTSFGGSLESKTFKNTALPNALFTQGFNRTVKIHLKASSQHCLAPRFMNQTLFVTILRDPLSRYVSEFDYLNLGKHYSVNSSSTLETVQRWSHNDSSSNVVRMDHARRKFIENYQTRWFTNECPCSDLDPAHSKDDYPNYRYWKSGCHEDRRMRLDANALEVAKSVVSRFDIVGIAPFFSHGGPPAAETGAVDQTSDSQTEQQKCDLLPLMELAGSNSPVGVVTNTAKNRGKRGELKAAIRVSTDAQAYLNQMLTLDNELFAYATAMVDRRTKLACCVKKLLA
jgi:hypothetical protein